MTAESAWQASVAKILNGADVSTLASHSRDGIAIGPLYPMAEATVAQPWRDTITPIHIVAHIEHPDPVEANRLASVEMESGATGLALVLAGASSARGLGVAAHDAAALAIVLDELPLETVTLRLELPPGLSRSAFESLTAVLVPPGAARSTLTLDLGFDPLGDQARTGIPDQIMAKTLATTVDALRAQGLEGPLLRVDGRPYHEAGASEAQELAAVLATGVSYLRALEAQGLDAARDALGFTLVADADQFLTTAKLRALRRLWARVEQACGLAPKPIRLHAETAWRMLTRHDPPTNLLRNTIAAAGAILGGADSLTVLPHTSALGLPDDFARRLARTTPLVLLEEAHLGRVADPAAGAGGFEALTEALCEEAWRLFQGLERDGGLARALEEGSWQAKVAEARSAREADLLNGTAVIVGVTRFVQADEPIFEAVPANRGAAHSPLALVSRREAEIFEATE